MYHLCRWIYILDAYDDLKDDFDAGNYNVLKARFNLTSPALPGEEWEYLQNTLEHSAQIVSASFELLPKGRWSEILENIIYGGISSVTMQVLYGTWKKKKSHRRDDEMELKE